MKHNEQRSSPVPDPLLQGTVSQLKARFDLYIRCAHAFGDEVSDEMLTLLDELCDRLSIKPYELVEEIARRDGLVKVQLDSGKTVLCFPDEMRPAESC